MFNMLVVLGLLPFSLGVLPSDFFYDIDGISVALSRRYFCAIEQIPGYEVGGAVRCFGNQDIVPPKDVFVQVATSTRGACGITLDQEVKCWGSPSHMFESRMEGSFTQISGGENVICGLKINGGIKCLYGKIKSFKIENVKGNKFVQISCGFNYCCALDNEGHVTCNGDVAFGYSMQSGNLHQTPKVMMEIGEDGDLSVVPEENIPKDKDSEEYEDFIMNPIYEEHPLKFKQIAVAHGYVCGIQYLDEDIFCWGNDDVELPVTVMKGPFRMVSANQEQVCGILSETNRLKCAYENALTAMEGMEWDQIKVGSLGQICGVSMNSDLICLHSAADPEILKEFIVG